jgi:guanosine-3',5'-bis(diphosphate) 3'-pyrophosphohydrolase
VKTGSINNRAIIRLSDLRRYQIPLKQLFRPGSLPSTGRIFVSPGELPAALFHRDYVKEMIAVTEKLDEAGKLLVLKAFDFVRQEFAGVKRISGRPFIDHLVDTALILRTVMENNDPVLLAAGLLHDVIEDRGVNVGQLAEMFGDQVANLVEAETKLSKELYGERRDVLSLKKWIRAIARDPSVALLKAADNLSNMKDQEVFPVAKRREHALETMEIYVPIMDAMGVWEARTRLEDLALPHLYPEEFAGVKELYDETLDKHAGLYADLAEQIKMMLLLKGIKGPTVEVRKRRISEIFRQMKKRELPFDRLLHENPLFLNYVNVVIGGNREAECYRALAIMRNLKLQPAHRREDLAAFRPRDENIRDFISVPRANNYRALQSRFVSEGEPGAMLVTVTTRRMNKENRLGFAAAGAEDKVEANWYQQRYDWMDKLLAYSRDLLSANEVRELIQEVTYPMTVYNQSGQRHKLPTGSTVLDFAFAETPIFAELALNARVNGVLAPLSTVLRANDTVDLALADRPQLTPTWLSWARSTETAKRIRSLLNARSSSEQVGMAIEALNREAAKYYLTWHDISDVAWMPDFIKHLNTKHRLDLASVQDLAFGVGVGWLDPEQVSSDFQAYFRDLLIRRTAEGTKNKRIHLYGVRVENRIGVLNEITAEISKLGLNIDANLAHGDAGEGVIYFAVTVYSNIQRDQVKNLLSRFGEQVVCRRIPQEKFKGFNAGLEQLVLKMGETE